MVRFGRLTSSIASDAVRSSASSAASLSKGLGRLSPTSLGRLSPSAYKVGSTGLTAAGKRVSNVAGNNVGSSAAKTAGTVGSSAADTAGSAAKSAKKTASSGADALTTGATRKARDAGDWIATSSKSGMKRMGRACRNNPVRCTAAMALAGYTAVNLAENSQAQQECITKCLPPNWPAAIDSEGTIEPLYFAEDPRPPVPGKKEEHKQPQCTEGTDCEPYCVAACKAEHPTTLLGAAMEGAGEMVDDLIVPFAEDVLGLPITDLGNGFLWVIRIVVIVVVIKVVLKLRAFLGLGKKRGGVSNVKVSLDVGRQTPAVATATPPMPVARPIVSANPSMPVATATPPLPVARSVTATEAQLANRAMDIVEKNPQLAAAGMNMLATRR